MINSGISLLNSKSVLYEMILPLIHKAILSSTVLISKFILIAISTQAIAINLKNLLGIIIYILTLLNYGKIVEYLVDNSYDRFTLSELSFISFELILLVFAIMIIQVLPWNNETFKNAELWSETK